MQNMFIKNRAPRRIVSMLAVLVMVLSSLSIGVFADTAAEYQDILDIGVVNFHSEWGERETNVAEMEKIVGEAAAAGVQFLLFPEMCTTGYRDSKVNPEDISMLARESEAIPGATSDKFVELAKTHNMYIVYGDTETIEGDERHAYNTAVVVGPEGYIGKYRKIHPVEGEWCVAGTEPFMFMTEWGPVGVNICYDIYATPELTRYYVANGCRLVLNPTASSRGYNAANPDDSVNWEWYYRARLEAAVDRDSVFVANANLVGEDGMKDENGASPGFFPGGSCVMGPSPDENGTYVKYFAGSTGDKAHGWSHGEIDLSQANVNMNLFGSDNWQPNLYAAWYKDLAANYKPVTERVMPEQDEIVFGVVNFEAKWGDKEANVEAMKTYIAEAAAEGVNMLVFPEMALTGYTYIEPAAGEEAMQVALAETVPGPSTEALIDLAKSHNMYIILGLPELKDDKVYNSAAILMPDGTIESYQKIHPVGDETQWCVRGDTPYSFDTPWGPVGLSICYDTYAIPELARYYAASGARIVLNPTATARGSTAGKWEWYYKNRIESTADRDQIVLVNANLAGTDGTDAKSVTFPGGSNVVGTMLFYPVYHGTAGEGNALDPDPGLIVSDSVRVGEPLEGDYRTVGFAIIGFNPSVFAKAYDDLANGVAPVYATAAAAGEPSEPTTPTEPTEPAEPAEEKSSNTMLYVGIAVVVVVVIFMLTRKKKPEPVAVAAGSAEAAAPAPAPEAPAEEAPAEEAPVEAPAEEEEK